jgi:leader peptidase (prepilin peptidase)/N-methyltransferase
VIGPVVSATDLAARRVPNSIVVPSYLIAAALLALACFPPGPWWPLARAGIAAALLGGFYSALGLACPAGMGLGDVRWAGVLGAYLGWL